LTLNEFRTAISDADVDAVTIDDRASVITGELDDGTLFRVTYPREFGDELTTDLIDAGVETRISNAGGSLLLGVFLSLLPVLVLLTVFLLIFKKMQSSGGGLFRMGKTQARKISADEPTVGFSDVAGADEAVEELQEIKDFLSNPQRFLAMGAKIPKGVLLYGPPGTGKTLLARAVAGEAGVPFFSLSGSDFVEMFVGVGASRVRDLFAQAKEAAPAIVFVDEIDAVGRHRGAGVGGGHDEREQTLNQLLVEMDGFDVATGVILIAATNRPDILDPALLRPGRFDRQIVVDRPDLMGRRSILAVHGATKPLGDDVDLETVARRTPGFTGADLANLMNESALLAARRDSQIIETVDLEAAIDRVIAGPERKNRVMSERERRIVAFHEAGHALVGHILQNTDPIHKVSIVSRGRALGWTLSLPIEDRYLKSRSELRDEMAMLLGGRAAEEMVFGDPTTGAADDIDRVTKLARTMVTEHGMSERVGPRRLGARRDEVFLGKEVGHDRDYSEEVAAVIDAEVYELVDIAHREARAILVTHRGALNDLAAALIEHETLDEDDLAEIFEGLESWDRQTLGDHHRSGVAEDAAVAVDASPMLSEDIGVGDRREGPTNQG
jgi:cell division protease FtsH